MLFICVFLVITFVMVCRTDIWILIALAYLDLRNERFNTAIKGVNSEKEIISVSNCIGTDGLWRQ